MKRIDILLEEKERTEKTNLEESRREEIIRSFLPFIKYTALRLSWRLPPQLTTEDLMSAGIAGLLESLDRYREELGNLDSFVKQRIRGAMIDELRANSQLSRSLREKLCAIRDMHRELEIKLGRAPEAEEIAEGLNISIEQYYSILSETAKSHTLRMDEYIDHRYDDELSLHESIPDRNMKTPETLFEEKRLKERIASLINKLPEKERLVLSLYYWDELTMKEIASILGITEGRVSQLHNQAIMRLRSSFMEEA
ncbi:MAG: FliA/WhiG family RNA polymerase sigma factor [Thermodesulfovibrionales bacterium]|nr:FliA/WhiG family RNA polymerase sigma factor [Thermodesulfovibrionales bacterium]